MLRLATINLLLVCSLGGSVRAATYFVRQTGNDEQSGLYPCQAWKSLTRAALLAKPGDTILVGAGKYAGRVRFTQDAAEHPITVIADRAGRMTGDVGDVVLSAPGSWVLCFDGASGIHVRGVQIRGRDGLGCWVRAAKQITLQDCSISDAQTGLRIDGPGDLLAERCVVRKCKESGVVLMKGATAVLRSCDLSENRMHGLLVSSEKEKLEIHRSRIARNAKSGLQLLGPTLAVNCLIDGNDDGVVIDANQVTLLHATVTDNRGHGVEHDDGDDVSVANSIVAYNAGTGIYSHAGNTNLAANVVIRNRSDDYRGIVMPPASESAEKLFNDKQSYRLAVKSPALNAGWATELAEDMVGNPRALGGGFDAGCLEFTRAEPQVYFVTPRGDDENDGTSSRFAWQTIGRATRQVVAGDVVYVGGGEYVEDLVSTRPGTLEKPITFIADTKGAKTGVAGQVTIAARETAWSWQLQAAHYARIVGFKFVPSNEPAAKKLKHGGLSIRESNGVELIDCELTKLENGLLAEWSEVTIDHCRLQQIHGQAATVTKGLLTAMQSRFERSGVGLVCLRDAMIDATDCVWAENVHGGVQCAGRAQLVSCIAERNGGAGLLIDSADYRLLSWKSLAVRGNRDFGISFTSCLLQLDKTWTNEWKLAKNGCAIGARGGNLVIEGGELFDNGKAAVVAENCQLVLRDLRLAGGVKLRGVRNSLLERCRVSGAGAGSGIRAEASEVAVRTCLIQDFASGVDLAKSDPPNRAAIWNSTIVNCAEHGVVCVGGDLLLKNSIVTGVPKSQCAVQLGEYGTFDHSHNFFFGFDAPLEGAALVATEIVTNPRLVDPEKRDFRLATASPAINAGLEAKGLADLDLTGHARPEHRAWDLGAFEFTEDNGSLRILQWKEQR